MPVFPQRGSIGIECIPGGQVSTACPDGIRKNNRPGRGSIFAIEGCGSGTAPLYDPDRVPAYINGHGSKTGHPYAGHGSERVSSAFADGHAASAASSDLSASGICYYSYGPAIRMTGTSYSFPNM